LLVCLFACLSPLVCLFLILFVVAPNMFYVVKNDGLWSYPMMISTASLSIAKNTHSLYTLYVMLGVHWVMLSALRVILRSLWDLWALRDTETSWESLSIDKDLVSFR
jgi:hypothetical protein